ncbi:cupin-like domain-containing protein [Gimibacter soli]|uniref:Cupin-like domain-containing protein n=1 Tax=Gimibacter soli TaxID=3024400 RepID=A0AAF0BGG5_9PROT|nr:cupin-like domain-containing protein [Gimibacter soli]WCL53473.1 cupin-like domain-containing protein [Gimibacter soli]
MQNVREVRGIAPEDIPFEELIDGQKPVVLRELVKDWALVKAGQSSIQAAMHYLLKFESGHRYAMYRIPSDDCGRVFYNEAMSAPNYQVSQVSFQEFLSAIEDQLSAHEAESYYIGSRDAERFFPGFRADNDLPLTHPMFGHGNLFATLWLGSKTRVAAHYDVSNNLACNLVGKRRFTLFPPEAVHSLYPGPLEMTPGGQALSMVDFNAPDYRLYPKFRDAIAAAQVAELNPGDVLFFPALWWHQVEAIEQFNVMMNYWWNDVPAHIDDPRGALLHSMLALRDRPEHEKHAWKHIFDHYVFGDPTVPRQHLPLHVRGSLEKLDAVSARGLRSRILRLLNR